MRTIRGLIIVAIVATASPAFAQDYYHQRNMFNRFTDWSCTFWRNPQDKERVINERINLRAGRRQMEDHAHNVER